MAATVEIDEQNGAGAGSTTHNISNSNMGSTDAPNLVAATYPITPGNNSFEKYFKLHVTAMGGSSKIDKIKIWRTGALGGADVHATNARESAYGGAVSYSAPVATALSNATQTMPTSEPTGANLGIAGSLSGSLTTTGSSDYLVHQIQTDSGTTAGSTSTLHIQYDETA